MNIFAENKVYSFQEVVDFCNGNDLVIVDCLKDENMISVEEWNDGELGDCIWEFKRIRNDLFRLYYVDDIYLKQFLKSVK